MPEARWKRHNRETARAFGTERTLELGRNAPDFETETVIAEVKSRQSLPKWLTAAVEQARGYAAPLNNKLPLVCLKEHGMRGFYVVIHSSDFIKWFGDLIDDNEN